ncbi:MAG: AraC family transcriptional regulator [Spirochaetales bacterium]|nr:AraC family transcriptional regulator [Spirochaetales bacterium]
MILKDAVFVYQMKELEAIKWHGRYHTHGQNDYELHYFVQGAGKFLSGDTLYNITPGTLFLTSPGVKHSIKVKDPGSPITYYALLIQPEGGDQDVEELLKEEIRRRPWYAIGSNYRFFFEELRERGMSGIKNLQKAAIHQLISFLYILSEGEDLSFHREGNVHLEKALRLMQNNVMGDLNLDDIAGRLELSQAYFIRLFRRRMGTTPMKYYTRLKVEAAGAMLTSTNMTTAAIAERLCFYSEFHFSRVFKQYTGHAPSIYRKNFLQRLGTAGKIQINDQEGKK